MRVAVPLPSPFDVEHIIVPGNAMRDWLAAELADRLGIWCNHSVYTPVRMLDKLGGTPGEPLGAWQVRDALIARSGSPGFDETTRYSANDATGVRGIQLAVRVAGLFGSYARFRPEMLASWAAGHPNPEQLAPEDAWQATLWRDLWPAGGDPLLAVAAILSNPEKLPRRLTVFGVDHLAPLEMAILQGLAQRIDVVVLALSGTPLAEALSGNFAPRIIAAAPPTTLLSRIQRGEVGGKPDESLLIHTTHGPMREVEVLRGRLLALFSADSSLQPEDVLVLAPDINDYAALIEGVFGSEADISKGPKARTRLPVCFADRSALVQSPGLAAMKSLLSLPHSRRPLSIVGELFSIGPVHARFGLTEDEAVSACEWLDSAAVRWGEDADFRARFHNPALPHHTWRWGLDRLLLGYAMEGQGDRPGEGRLFADILPVDGIEGNNALPLGGLCAFCTALFDHLERLERVYTPTEWATVLLSAYDALISTRGVWASSRLLLVRALGELKGKEPIAIGGVSDWLVGQLEQVEREEYFCSGGVNCASLRTGRVVPARVVALLGLDFDRFPRDPTSLAFDLVSARPLDTDLPARAEDRLIFRDALLAASDHLHLSYVGRGSRDNKERPPSVLVSEILDLLPPATRAGVTVSHPMQPFSPRAFGDPRVPNYSISLHRGATALLGDPQAPAPFFPTPLTPDATTATVDLTLLIRFLQNPVAALLKRRLDLSSDDLEDDSGDTEPFDLGYLELWQVGDPLVRAMLAGADATSLWPAMRESGLLPMGTPGRTVYDGLATVAGALVATANACGAGAPRPNVDLDVLAPTAKGSALSGGQRLTGRLDGRRAKGALYVTYSKLDAKRLLPAWTRHLAGQAAGLTPTTTWAVGRGTANAPVSETWQAVPEPVRWVGQLLALYAEGMTRPLPFMPKSSLAYAESYLANRGPAAAEAEVRRGAASAALMYWLPSKLPKGGEIPGEGDDPAVARVFDSTVVTTDEFHRLALRIFAPMQGTYSLPESKP